MGATCLRACGDWTSLLVCGLSGKPCAFMALGRLHCPPGQGCGVEQVASQRAAPATSRRLGAGYWGVSHAWGHSSSCSDGPVTSAALWVGEGESKWEREVGGLRGWDWLAKGQGPRGVTSQPQSELTLLALPGAQGKGGLASVYQMCPRKGAGRPAGPWAVPPSAICWLWCQDPTTPSPGLLAASLSGCGSQCALV